MFKGQKRILVIGSGGREHALVRALSLSPSQPKLFAAPGSAAISHLARCFSVTATDVEGILSIVRAECIDLVVIGPEVAIQAGVSDALRAAGIEVFGPSFEAGHLETSKIYAKKFMDRARVPTAPFQIVTRVAEAMQALTQFTPPYVLKADGLAAGKGVFICQTKNELREAAELLFEHKSLGEAGAQALLEQFYAGYELSVLILTNGKEYQVLPIAQDHKRLLDGDQGPNTGGMGTVAPLKVDPALMAEIHESILKPTVDQLKREHLLYRGVVFLGLMITESGPKVLEYNVRFGDPETQVICPLVNEDWVDLLSSIAKGEVPTITENGKAAACVVLASGGYPDNVQKGTHIAGLENVSPTENAYWLHAGTQFINNKWITSGGRVLNALGVADSIADALNKAYGLIEPVCFEGMHFRKDIGRRQLPL